MRQERFVESGLARKAWSAASPFAREARRHGIAVARVADRGLKEIGELQPAEAQPSDFIAVEMKKRAAVIKTSGIKAE